MSEGPLPTLGELLEHFPPVVAPKIRFLNPDIDYLWRKTNLDHHFVGRALRSFGEAVVLEGLRRCVEASINEPKQAWGLMKNVSAEKAGFR